MKRFPKGKSAEKRSACELLGLLGAGLFGASLLTGCANSGGVERGQAVRFPMEAGWQAVGEGRDGEMSSGWLAEFQDGRLRGLVTEALAANHSLKVAAGKVEMARQSLRATRAGQLPGLEGTLRAGGSDGSRVAFSKSYRGSVQVSWEADLWGKLRLERELSAADERIARADLRAARLSLVAQVAKAWFALIAAEEQLELAGTTLESYRRALPVIERRYRASTLRAVDVQFGRNNVSSAQRSLEERKLARDEAARTLELLLGRYPGAELVSGQKLPGLRREVAAGFPAQLLGRRPDLVAAAEAVHQAARQAQVARCELLPDLQLSGGVTGSSSGGWLKIFEPRYLLWSAAASLGQTLVDGGARDAAVRRALAEYGNELESYAQEALQAFREVESALQADASLRQQEELLRREVEQTTLAERRALSDLTLGLEEASFLEYLEAQRRAEDARASLIRLRNERLQNRVDLYLALGGAGV